MIHVVPCLINDCKQDIHTEEKLKIVLEGVNAGQDLCKKYDLKPTRFYYWKDQLLNCAPEIFENCGQRSTRIA